MTIKRLPAVLGGKADVLSPICIVGAGVAGLLMAHRIARSGRKVVVIESGEELFDAEIHKLNQIEEAAPRYSRALTGRYRGLGGSSSRWGGRMIPVSAHESGDRSYISQAKWPFPVEQLAKYESDIERLFETGSDSYEDISKSAPRIAAAFPDLKASMTPRWAKCPTFKKCNIATVLMTDLKSMSSLEIWLGATVCDFEVDSASGRLTGLVAQSVNGRNLTVRAERFVVAAGTIESTRLLLLLKERTDGYAFRRSNVLGRYFQDHLKAEVAKIDRADATTTNRLFAHRFIKSVRRDLHLELSKAAQTREGVSSAFAYVSMDLAGSPLQDIKNIAHGLQKRQVAAADLWRVSRNIGLLARSAYWRVLNNQLFVPGDIDLRMLICVEQLPQWSNRITLGNGRDRFGLPKALLEWAPTETDERTFRAAVSHLDAYWRHAGFDRTCPLIWMNGIRDASSAIIDRSEACAHPSGSTRMGTNPAESVVGPDLSCHDVPNLSVLSASVFPTAGSANPTFTIMKLACWLADSYLGTVKQSERVVVPARMTKAAAMGV
ncbi:GMC oxidoreductase [Oryzicola mucosus]|uniref:GMC family oxidoreductase n=1 Tax=Oryzicola mucosus TaxID=2767425 RepID=A0A8J6PP04_9HYPH|nr:GMC oxidoreductase [Oryzicola mucosus]MBD0415672.1 GMC family oxidoreductase [Oryzicola mucosus]